MNCPSCNEETTGILECEQCSTSYCEECQPYWDYSSNICGTCQEQRIVAACSEGAFTRKLRRMLNRKANPQPPNVHNKLPWEVVDVRGRWLVMSDGLLVARFEREEDARWAARCANNHHHLMQVVADTYNRIRDGDVIFDGGENACRMWSRIVKVINDKAGNT